MKLVGFIGNDFNVDQLKELGANVEHRGSFDAHLKVRPYNAFIGFDSYDENRYRPYLQLDVEVIGGVGSFGNNVTEFQYRENDRINRSVRYNLTDHEIAVLVEKGLYQTEFEVPDILLDADLEIPVEMDVTEVEINGRRLMYASYDMIADFVTDSEKSEYDIVSYFEDQHYEDDVEQQDDYESTIEGEEDVFNHEDEAEFEDDVEETFEQEDQLEEETEDVIEAPKVYETAMDRVAGMQLSDVSIDVAGMTSEIEDIVGDIEQDIKPVDERKVESVVDTLDAGKANTEELMRRALEDSADDEHGSLSPDAEDEVEL